MTDVSDTEQGTDSASQDNDAPDAVHHADVLSVTAPEYEHIEQSREPDARGELVELAQEQTRKYAEPAGEDA